MMASSLMHICVAKIINQRLKKDERLILLGSIAPDLSKLVGEDKVKSHFLDNPNVEIPNLNRFLDKYKNKLNDDFIMGYYIHLYTDYLWFKYFLGEIMNENTITELNGDKVPFSKEQYMKYIYSDYTNLNPNLIDLYKIDFKIFYEELPKINNVIDEIPCDKLQLLVDNAGIIIKNSYKTAPYVFNMENAIRFINFSKEIIYNDIKRTIKF